MAYKFVVNTNSYKDMACSKKNWEKGTVNDFMHAINGWSIRENNLKHVEWRIGYFGGWAALGVDGMDAWNEYKAWEDGHQRKNYIKFWDSMCEFDRTQQVKLYGFCQGYFDVREVIEKLRKDGSVRIMFEDYYDPRQFNKNMKGCYIEITKC